MSTLKDILKTKRKMADELPLVHTTRCEWLPSFVQKPQIDPRYCKVFKQDLIYLFYGYPAYRSKNGGMPSEGIHLCPICFVFKPGTVSVKVHRFYPCDTGALKDAVYTLNKKNAQPKLTWQDRYELELAPDITSARKHVAYFFGTNADYFAGKIDPRAAKPGPGAAKRWYELVSDKRPKKADERKFAIEVQVNQPMPLRGNLECVILHREFMEDNAISDALKRWKCKIIEYGFCDAARPADGYPLIVDRVSTYYVKKGIL